MNHDSATRNISKIIQECLIQPEFKSYSDTRTDMIPMTILGIRSIQFWLQMTSKFQHIHEERLVIDEIGLLGNLGGLLGLFVGFSIFGYWTLL